MCPICKGPCLKGTFCLVCENRHTGVDTFEVNDGHGTQQVSAAAFYAFMGGGEDAHGHLPNERRSYDSLLRPPLTNAQSAWNEHSAALLAVGELLHRGADVAHLIPMVEAAQQ